MTENDELEEFQEPRDLFSAPCVRPDGCEPGDQCEAVMFGTWTRCREKGVALGGGAVFCWVHRLAASRRRVALHWEAS